MLACSHCSLTVWYHLVVSWYPTAIWLFAVSPQKPTFSPPWAGVAGSCGSPGPLPKSINFELSPGPSKITKSSPQSHQKTPTCDPNPSPRTQNYGINGKSEIIQNTKYLLWFWHMRPSHSSIIFIPRSLKTWTWKQSPFATPNPHTLNLPAQTHTP